MDNEKGMTEEEFNNYLLEEFLEEEKAQIKKEREFKDSIKKELESLINIEGLFNWLEDGHDSWTPIGIVDIKLTDEKLSGYSSHSCARVVDEEDKLLYMKTDMDDAPEGIDYYYVWQTNHFEDSYSGFLLFELKNGKFFKISYNY